MYKGIMVAVESLERDRPAVSAAVRLARRSAARLHVVHVREGSNTGVERETLLRAAEWTSEELDESVSFELIDPAFGHSVADHLVNYALAHDIDLVVMGTHGRGQVGRLVIGSVAETVVQSLDVPVLLLPRRSQRFKMRRLLVALDGTRESEQILDQAAELAALFGSAVTLLQVIEPPPAERDPLTARKLPLAHEEFVLRCARSEEYLDRMADRFRERALDVNTTTLVGTQVGKVVKKAARDEHADLVALMPRTIDVRVRMVKGGVTDRLLERGGSALLLRRRLTPAGTTAGSRP